MADEDPQGIRQVPGQGGGDEFGEDLPVRKVRVDDILEAVLEDEPVEEVRCNDEGSRDQDADAFPMVIEVVPLENLVQEGQAAGLAAQGAVPEAGKADGVVVALGLEAGHDAESLGHPVVSDGADGGRPALRLVVEAALLDAVANLEEAAGEEPAGDIVLGRQPGQVGIRKGGDDALGAVQVAGAGDFLPGLGIRHYEIAESEFPADEIRQVVREGFGTLHEETRLEGRSDGPHAFLGGLHEDGHLGIVLADHPAQVDAGVQLLLRGLVAGMQDETDVGDDAQHVGLVFLVQGHGVVVVRGHEDLGPGAFPQALLALVEGVADGLAVLKEDQAVQLRQVSGVVPDGILHEEDALHTVLQDVHRCVPAVFQELDDGDDQVRGVVPAEDAVEVARVPVLHLPVNLLGKGRQEDDRGFRVDFLHPAGELEHIDFTHIVHRDDKVELGTGLHHGESLHGGFGPQEFRRVRQVQFRIFDGDPGLDPAVLFQGELVIVVAHEEDPADPSCHQGRSRFSHCSVR